MDWFFGTMFWLVLCAAIVIMFVTLCLAYPFTGLMILLVGCIAIYSTRPVAYAEIRTTTDVFTIVNPRRSLSDALEMPNNIYLPEGEMTTVHFICPKCNYDEKCSLVPPTSQIFSCDCKFGSYIVICVIVGEEPAESTE